MSLQLQLCKTIRSLVPLQTLPLNKCFDKFMEEIYKKYKEELFQACALPKYFLDMDPAGPSKDLSITIRADVSEAEKAWQESRKKVNEAIRVCTSLFYHNLRNKLYVKKTKVIRY